MSSSQSYHESKQTNDPPPHLNQIPVDAPPKGKRACDFCRGRRIKCQVAPDSPSCLSCRSRNRTCTLAPRDESTILGGDLADLGPMAMLRKTLEESSNNPAALSVALSKMNAELKIYKDMAQFYQTKISALSHNNPENKPKVDESSFNFSSSGKTTASSPNTSSNLSPMDFEFDLDKNPVSPVEPTRELMIQLQQASVASINVMSCGEFAYPVMHEIMEARFVTLCSPLEFNDVRAPEDTDEVVSGTIIATSDFDLDRLVELWEYAVMFLHGATTLRKLDMLRILAENSERLMRAVIFQRQAHTKERYAEKLVRTLCGMSIYYRHCHKLGAASSVLMIAHQIIVTFPSLIPPAMSDRVYVLLLLGASTEHERKEWLNMLQDQIYFTTSSLLSFYVSFIVSKFRTSPTLAGPVREEVRTRIEDMDNLARSLSCESALYQTWLKILIECVHAEFDARTKEISSAYDHLKNAGQILKDHYSSYLASILMAELRNFAKIGSPCLVQIDGKESTTTSIALGMFQRLVDEASASSSTLSSPSLGSTTEQYDVKDFPFIGPDLQDDADIINVWSSTSNRLNDQLFGISTSLSTDQFIEADDEYLPGTPDHLFS